jgi:hypothetical protein
MEIIPASRFADRATYLIRPALAEAKLITAKRARDMVYVTTIGEELRNIERSLDALEQQLHLGTCEEPEPCTPAADSADLNTVNRIRAKSCELERRLRRIEKYTMETANPAGLSKRHASKRRLAHPEQ